MLGIATSCNSSVILSLQSKLGITNQVKKTQKAIKAEKARQKIKAGQQQLAQSGSVY